ncbi:MAG TPA: LemA family protein [Candidatus Brocadiia bacterium]|nr:LemA family protein [Candidatus Brocadiia bacterium]
MIGLWIALGVVVLLALIVAGMYNGLVVLRKQVDNAWAQIDVQLKRRHDLIPNLVETVKGYAGHEKTLLENVTKARARAMDARSQGPGEQIQAETALGGALRGLMVQMEAYPDLKANQNFLALQEELSSTENKISFARQHYNDITTNYNTSTELFPRNIIAGMFGFTPRKLWEIEDAAERQAPQVKF